MKLGEEIKLQSSTAVIYGQYGRDLMNTNCGRWFEGQKVENKVKGKFTKQSKKRFTDIIKNWMSVIDAIESKKGFKKTRIGKYMKFLTLTLSATQYMSDQEVRREMFNPLIRDLKKYNNLKSYLYCSEAQENGNIHFHLVVDRFIPWEDIRKYWNRIQASKCYINLFEMKYLHRNPNSIDIHEWEGINNPAAYLIKYFTKDESKRKLIGRLWGCSENLKLIEPYRTEIDYKFADFLNTYIDTFNPDIFKSDYFSYFRKIDFETIKQISPNIYNKIITFYTDQLHHL